MKGSEQVNKSVEKEEETLTSHESATAGVMGEAEGFTPQPTHSQLTVSLLQQGITGNTGFQNETTQDFFNHSHFVSFLC